MVILSQWAPAGIGLPGAARERARMRWGRGARLEHESILAGILTWATGRDAAWLAGVTLHLMQRKAKYVTVFRSQSNRRRRATK